MGYAWQLKVVTVFKCRVSQRLLEDKGSMIALLNPAFYTKLLTHPLAHLRLLRAFLLPMSQVKTEL